MVEPEVLVEPVHDREPTEYEKTEKMHRSLSGEGDNEGSIQSQEAYQQK